MGVQNQAVAAGGNLVTINDASEQNWLLTTFGSTENLYIGLTDSTVYGAIEGEFRWVSGQPVTYTNWVPGEPNNGGVEQLEGFVHLYNLFNGKWNDTTNQGLWAKPARGIVEVE